MYPVKLDNRDISILKVISVEGRISKTDLANKINLSATACLERLKKLEKSGVIASYNAKVSLAKLAPHINVFVTLELREHRATSFQKIERTVEQIEEVTNCWALGGGVDYLLQVTTRDIDSYQMLIEDLLEKKLGIHRYFTYIVTKSVKESAPPFDILFANRD